MAAAGSCRLLADSDFRQDEVVNTGGFEHRLFGAPELCGRQRRVVVGMGHAIDDARHATLIFLDINTNGRFVADGNSGKCPAMRDGDMCPRHLRGAVIEVADSDFAAEQTVDNPAYGIALCLAMAAGLRV